MVSCNLSDSQNKTTDVGSDIGIDPAKEDAEACKCDPSNMMESCESFGFGGGKLKCGATCNFDTSDCLAPLSCGDGKRDSTEACEGLDLNGKTCERLGFLSGELRCSDTCTLDTTACSSCGDGLINDGEMCDGENLNEQTCASASATGVGYGTLACTADCKFLKTNCYTIEKVSVGEQHTCAITSKKEIVCWGDNTQQQSTPPLGTDFVGIASGPASNCAIDQMGAVSCWGSNNYPIPPNIAGQKIVQIDVDRTHACAISEDGTLTCWGINILGQLDVDPGTYLEVSLGNYSTCAIDETNTIHCWGHPAVDRPPKNGAYAGIDATTNHFCALEGSTYSCWGNNSAGQLVGPDVEFSAITAGNQYTCGISNGEILCWGQPDDEKLVSPTGTFVTISAGENHTCAVTEAGEVKCWGKNADGQLDF